MLLLLLALVLLLLLLLLLRMVPWKKCSRRAASGRASTLTESPPSPGRPEPSRWTVRVRRLRSRRRARSTCSRGRPGKQVASTSSRTTYCWPSTSTRRSSRSPGNDASSGSTATTTPPAPPAVSVVVVVVVVVVVALSSFLR